MRCRLNGFVLAAAIWATAVPAGAQSESLTFIPRIYSVEGALEFGGLTERQSTTRGGETATVTDTYFTERISLTATGWVYHPRFLLFLARVGGGLAQERVDSGVEAPDSGGTRSETLTEYELRTTLLPEHPYNLELYTVRRNPYSRGQVSLGSVATGTDTGAVFRLKDRPYICTLGYESSDRESNGVVRNSDTLNANAVYYRDWGDISGALARVDAQSTFDGQITKSTSDTYSIENRLRFFDGRFALSSILRWNQVSQQSEQEDLEDRSHAWNERLDLSLPLRLEMNVLFTRFTDESTRQPSSGGAATSLDNTTENLGFGVTHRLYRSLTTSYNGTLLSVTSSTGDSKGFVQALSSTYVKQIPRGLLTAGIALGDSSIDRSGAPAIVNEAQGAPLFGEITLRQTDADPGSVSLRVKSATTGDEISLTVGVHYRVFTVGDTVRVAILALPAEALSDDPFYQYAFIADYSLASLDANVATSTYGGSLRLDLFDNFLSPYAAYTRTSQEESVGTGAAVTYDTTSLTLGVQLQRLPYTLLVEYQDVRSDLNPYRRERAEASGQQALTDHTRLLGRVSYARTAHDAGVSQENEFTDQVFEASLRLQERPFRRRFTLFLGGSYNQSTGLADRRAYSADAEVSWVLRQLEISVTASIGRSLLDTGSGTQEALHQLYYFKLTRKLF